MDLPRDIMRFIYLRLKKHARGEKFGRYSGNQGNCVVELVDSDEVDYLNDGSDMLMTQY